MGGCWRDAANCGAGGVLVGIQLSDVRNKFDLS